MTKSQGNGALMRIGALGIFGWKCKPEELAKLAAADAADAADAALTHPNSICRQANRLYEAAIAAALREGHRPQRLYERIAAWGDKWNVDHARDCAPFALPPRTRSFRTMITAPRRLHPRYAARETV